MENKKINDIDTKKIGMPRKDFISGILASIVLPDFLKPNQDRSLSKIESGSDLKVFFKKTAR